MEPARFFIFSYSNGVSRVRWRCRCLCRCVSVCRCMLVGHLNPPYSPLSSSLTMIDVSSFRSPRPSLSCPGPPVYHCYVLCVLCVPLSCCPFRDPTFSVFPSFLFMMIQAKPIDRWLLSRIYFNRETVHTHTHTQGEKTKPERNSRNHFIIHSIVYIFFLCFTKR